jgi:ABC-2 type transport system permease protein
MNTFTAYFKKEIMESIRHYRYLVLGIGIMLFGILDPIMLKILPTVMKDQLPVDISSLMTMITPKYMLQDYIKNLFQLSNLFITLSLMGMLRDEISEERLVFPYSKGCKPWGIVLAKVIHYSIVVMVLVIGGFSLNYYYGGLLFKGESASFGQVMVSALLVSLYFSFNISIVALMSSVFKKSIAAGIAALVISYFMPLAANIKSIVKFLPYTLISTANLFEPLKSSITPTIITTVICIILLNAAVIYRLRNTEVV